MAAELQPAKEAARVCSWEAVQRLCAREATLAEHRRQADAARHAAALALERARRIVRLRRAAAAAAQRVSEQREQVEARARCVEEAAAVCASGDETAAADDAGEPVAEAARVAGLVRHLRQERIILEDMRAMLARQRGRAAQAAGEAFPVELGVDGGWTVCGMRLARPDSAQGWQVAETAAGLGAVARCVEWVARCIVGVPLRFPLIPHGSRSTVVGPGGVELPLFMLRPADRPRLRAAVRLVEANVEQLLWAFGIAAADRHELLPNLTQLLMAIESASFAS
ncbi:hypothetical protein IWQ57_003545 [Coemansia nantahalensis]|uniref:Uncharacterized protein n=1 Tax=Coemansia nantahalensis TaxID=2789366 RepID=A0ACC1JVY2_9FUNG|nr:hypothetical protein IWQ57_003545 [Coemansia nantahalensis]